MLVPNLWPILQVLSQTQADPTDAAAAVQVNSIWDFMIKGGPMMIPIGICSLIAAAVTLERLFSLRRSTVIPPGFLDGLKQALGHERNDRAAALQYCKENACAVAEVLRAGIKKLGQSAELVEKHISEAGQREITKLGKYLRVLIVIAAISPLMGLLGTIFGMIKAFQTVAMSGEALGKTELLAGGIYEAMITTAAGLLVAIPVLVAYHWITAKIDRLVSEMDLMTVEFVEEYAGPGVEALADSIISRTPDRPNRDGDGDGDGAGAISLRPVVAS
ncbi:MAG: MotA/TolQ/ExbB proton channel family protein [Phycisphaerae bacterium]